MSIREEVIRLVEDLPESDLIAIKRILHGLKLVKMSEPALPLSTAEERRAKIRAVRGILAHTHTSVDAFLARKREEVDLEEERHRARYPEQG